MDLLLFDASFDPYAGAARNPQQTPSEVDDALRD
jgi:hypothetical protein